MLLTSQPLKEVRVYCKNSSRNFLLDQGQIGYTSYCIAWETALGFALSNHSLLEFLLAPVFALAKFFSTSFTRSLRPLEKFT